MAESFSDQIVFSRKKFPAPGSKMSCHIICTVLYFSNKNYFVFVVNTNKRTRSTMPSGYGKLKTKSAESLGGGAEKIEKNEVKFFMGGWGQNHCTKTN